MARRCELTGRGVQTGNNVSHAHNKSRRRYLPNVRDMKLMSDVLGRAVRLRVSAYGLRSIEHKGGLDKYLLNTDDAKLSLRARRLKRDVRKAVAAKETTG